MEEDFSSVSGFIFKLTIKFYPDNPVPSYLCGGCNGFRLSFRREVGVSDTFWKLTLYHGSAPYPEVAVGEIYTTTPFNSSFYMGNRSYGLTGVAYVSVSGNPPPAWATFVDGWDAEGSILYCTMDSSASSPSTSLSSTSYSSYSTSSVSSRSSTSSSTSMSSSSSSLEIWTADVFSTLIVQNHNNIIPFNYFVENAYNIDTIENINSSINFDVEISAASVFEYASLLKVNSNSSVISQDIEVTDLTDIYVDNPQEYRVRHDPSFYIDIFVEGDSGVKDVSVRGFEERYDFEDIEHSYIVPKFKWDNKLWLVVNANSKTVTTTDSLKDKKEVLGTAIVGTFDGQAEQYIVSTTSASLLGDYDLASKPESIIQTKDNGIIYVSAEYDFYSLYANSFIDEDIYNPSHILSQKYHAVNDNAERILYCDEYLWTSQNNTGKLFKRDKDNLDILFEYDETDGIHKMLYSGGHSAYILSGKHILWKIDGNNISAIYSIDDASIIDFDVSEYGNICVIFSYNNESIIRIFSPDMKKIIVEDSFVDGRAVKCCYCNKGRFYVLEEILSDSTKYVVRNCVYNILDGSVNKVDATSSSIVTTTTTTYGGEDKIIDVKSPIANDIYSIGTKIEIKWLSNKSINDSVDIYLYKLGYLYEVIGSKVQNSGTYEWEVPSNIDLGEGYSIVVKWLAPNDSAENMGQSGVFSILSVSSTTTTTTTIGNISGTCVSVDFVEHRDAVILFVSSGVFGLFNLTPLFENEKQLPQFYGLYGMSSRISCALFNDNVVVDFGAQDGVRITVGSHPYSSDKWDSGEISTELTSMYYGGGNNLKGGCRYYVGISTHSPTKGWSYPQIKEFVMPK